jgi:MarR family transcriptional regulator, organic hydroperoxide resistance regulator
MPTSPQRPVTARRLGATLDFMRLLWSIENSLQSTSKRMEATLGVTGPQRLVLKIVARFPDISAKEVAELLHLHPSTVTGVLQRLTEKGLLAREPDPADARRAQLRVRPAARKFIRQDTGTVEAAVAHALSRLPASSVRRAHEVLAAVIDELEAE